MKKSLLLLMFALCSAPVYASYYDDISVSYETPGWLIFFSIIEIAAGILQICLFFKLWKMTNDVASIKDMVDYGVDKASDYTLFNLARRVRNLHFSGRNEAAFGLLNSFLYLMLKKVDKAEEIDGVKRLYLGWESSIGEMVNKPVDTYIKDSIAKVERLYKLIGKEVPSELRTFSYEKFMAFTKEN